MLDGKGNVVRPDYVADLLQAPPGDRPDGRGPTRPRMYEGKGIPLPNGLRFIFGYQYD